MPIIDLLGELAFDTVKGDAIRNGTGLRAVQVTGLPFGGPSFVGPGFTDDQLESQILSSGGISIPGPNTLRGSNCYAFGFLNDIGGFDGFQNGTRNFAAGIFNIGTGPDVFLHGLFNTALANSAIIGSRFCESMNISDLIAACRFCTIEGSSSYVIAGFFSDVEDSTGFGHAGIHGNFNKVNFGSLAGPWNAYAQTRRSRSFGGVSKTIHDDMDYRASNRNFGFEGDGEGDGTDPDKFNLTTVAQGGAGRGEINRYGITRDPGAGGESQTRVLASIPIEADQIWCVKQITVSMARDVTEAAGAGDAAIFHLPTPFGIHNDGVSTVAPTMPATLTAVNVVGATTATVSLAINGDNLEVTANGVAGQTLHWDADIDMNNVRRVLDPVA